MTISIDIFPWDENFNTGIATVDEQHRKLVGLLNMLASHVAFRADTLALDRIFDDLVDYTRYHFETEEAIWSRHLGGEEMERAHREAHRGFVETAIRLKAEQGCRPLDEVAEEALGFLARWLASHILESDRYMAYVVQALTEGRSREEARQQANARMSGATRALIDIILSIYDTLSTNTLRLMREIAERKRREIELIQTRLQAESANLAKSQFLANISHEVRTPLNGMLGAAQLLDDDGVADDERRGYARLIIESGHALISLVDDLLSLSTVEAGTLTIEHEPFEPRSLIREMQERYAAPTASKGIELETSVEEWVAPAYIGDIQRLRQMLGNLMSNAVKFTEHGRIRVAVRESGRAEGKAMLEFSVSDTGIGIDDAKCALLFQPFSQVDGSIRRLQGGTGIGLSIVRSLAELMGGSAGVDSKPGSGSRFWFTIHAAIA